MVNFMQGLCLLLVCIERSRFSASLVVNDHAAGFPLRTLTHVQPFAHASSNAACGLNFAAESQMSLDVEL